MPEGEPVCVDLQGFTEQPLPFPIKTVALPNEPMNATPRQQTMRLKLAPLWQEGGRRLVWYWGRPQFQPRFDIINWTDPKFTLAFSDLEKILDKRSGTIRDVQRIFVLGRSLSRRGDIYCLEPNQLMQFFVGTFAYASYRRSQKPG